MPVALTVGYTNNHNGYDFRIFESSNENVLHLKADAVGLQWVTFRAHYEYGSRTGSGLDEASLVEIGEQPLMRHYDLANRTRNRFVGQVDVTPSEALTLSVSAGSARTTSTTALSACRRPTFRNVLARAPTTSCRAASASAAPTTTSGTPGCSSRDRRVPAISSDDPEPRLDDRLQGARPLLLGLRAPAAHRHATPRCAHLVRLRIRATATTSTPSGRRCRRHRSCRRRLQQAAGLPGRRQASGDRAAGGDLVLRL